MEEEYCELKCGKCGNSITFVDSWQEGCRFNDDIILICNKCKNEIDWNINDTISELNGAEWKHKID